MWICLVLFGHRSQAQVFQPLPSLQLLVPFHMPGHGAAGKTIKNWGRQQDCHHFPKIKLAVQTTGTRLLYLLDLPLIPADQFFHGQKSKQLIILIGWAIFRQRIPKQCYQWLGQNQQTLNNSNHPRLSATPRSFYLASPAHRPPGEGIWVHLQRDQRKWMIMMFSQKHAWTLGPGIYPGEPKHGASSETRKPCKTGYIGGLQGPPPFVDPKMVQKQLF